MAERDSRPYATPFAIGAEETGERLAAASAILRGRGVVVLEGALALHSEAGYLYCDVLDPTPSAHRCEQEYAVLVENAQRLLDASTLGASLPPLPQEWSVVEDLGNDRAEVRHPGRHD